MSLSKKLENLRKIRFYIADLDDHALSSCWFVGSSGQGVYVAPSVLGASLKLSFHSGGALDGNNCQFGHPRQYADRELERGFEPLKPLRWRRAPTPAIGALHVASLLFPTDGLLSAPQPSPDGKLKFALPAAPSGSATEVAFFLSKEEPHLLENKFILSGQTPMAYADFPGGEFFSIVVRHVRREKIALSESLIRANLKPLSGSENLNGSINARAVLFGDPPNEGSAFYLEETAPIIVSRGGT